MDYIDHLNTSCPTEIVQLFQETRMQEFPEATITSLALKSGGGYPCAEAVILAMTPRLDGRTDQQLLRDYFNGLLNYVTALPEGYAEEVRAAVLRIGTLDPVAKSAYRALRHHGIDIRDMALPDPAPDWSFTQADSSNAAAWHRALYLASFGEAEAYGRLADKIAQTTNGNDAYGLIKSLQELDTPEAAAIVDQYRNDTRHTDGPSGPGLTIAELLSAMP